MFNPDKATHGDVPDIALFTIRLRDGVYPDNWTVTAKAVTLRSALGFVGEFCALRSMLIEAPWVERNGRYVMDVYDWCDCWFADPPVLAQVIAPPGFIPANASANAEPIAAADVGRQ